MIKYVFALLLLVSVVFISNATEYKSDEYNYSISSVGRGVNGSLLVKIKCSVSSPNEAVSYASKCAVHGLVFKGAVSENGSPNETPLVLDKELSVKEKEWFDNMFQSGAYSQYIVSQSNMKIARIKKQYSVEVTIAVNKSKLRKSLEDEEIIKRLGSVFENK